MNDFLYGVQPVLSALRHEKRNLKKLYLKKIQTHTDEYIKIINENCSKKEQEILNI